MLPNKWFKSSQDSIYINEPEMNFMEWAAQTFFQ